MEHVTHVMLWHERKAQNQHESELMTSCQLRYEVFQIIQVQGYSDFLPVVYTLDSHVEG